MKVYLAGPMSGLPDYNFPAFHAATVKLREEGYEVFSPAEEDLKEFDSVEKIIKLDELDHDALWRERLIIDFKWIQDHAEAIALLPGWTKSKGAQAEWALANALGLEVMYLD